jgi:hypothetical protein
MTTETDERIESSGQGHDRGDDGYEEQDFLEETILVRLGLHGGGSKKRWIAGTPRRSPAVKEPQAFIVPESRQGKHKEGDPAG